MLACSEYKSVNSNIQQRWWKYALNIGIHWNITVENFFFSSKIIDSPPEMRGLPSAVSTIFDPFGLLAPFIMKIKLLLQSMWSFKIGWDDKLPPLEAEYCEKLWESLFNINQVHVPRCYNSLKKDVLAYEVHIFSDASDFAYGAVTYLNLVFTNGTSTLSFVMGKSRLLPVKTGVTTQIGTECSCCWSTNCSSH